MLKFAVFSGFLGAGKTTAMMALTRHYTGRYGNAAMISNDLGKDVTLADNRLAQLAGCEASEITGECICFVRDVLAKRLNAYGSRGFDLVLSDIPGFGVGALEHVYHGLEADFPGQFSLGPFTVLTEPRSVCILMREESDDMAPILHAQLMEADLIVLNKCDLLNADEVRQYLAFLAECFPQAKVLPISAVTGEGMDALSLALKEGTASMRHPEIDYEDPRLIAAMDSLTEYYLQYYATVCCNDFDGTAYLRELAEQIRDGLAETGFECPHFKLLAWSPEGDYGRVDLLGVRRPIEISHPFSGPCTQLAVLLNTGGAACPAAALEHISDQAVRSVSAHYQLDLIIHKKQCFNLGE